VKKKLLPGLASLLFLVGMAGMAQATLFVDGTVSYGGTEQKIIYDDDLDITWLDYTNSKSRWSSQVAWAGGLSFDINGVTFDNWRLPSLGEMVHLHDAELGYYGSCTPSSTLNSGDFDNLISELYWTGSLVESLRYNAYAFNNSSRWQSSWNQGQAYSALAALPGRVAAPVPEPATMLLFGTGMAGLAGMRLIRKKK